MNVRNIEVLKSAISHHSHQTSLMAGCGYNRLNSPYAHCVENGSANAVCPHNVS